jgi:hypothetical protein
MRLRPDPKFTPAARVRRKVRFAARVEPLEFRLLLSSGASSQASSPSLVVAFDRKTPIDNGVTSAGQVRVDGKTNLKGATVWVGYGDGFYSSTRSGQPIKVGMHGSFSFDTPLWVGANTIVVAISSAKGNGAHQLLDSETLNLTRTAVPTRIAGGPGSAVLPTDLSALVKIRTLRETPYLERDLVRDRSTSALFVRTSSAEPGYLSELQVADELYRSLGIAVPMSRLFQTNSGLVQIAAWVSGRTLNQVRRSDPALAGKVEQQLRQGFVVDALLDNQDVFQHVVVSARGIAWRTDNGSTLDYNSDGSPKASGTADGYPLALWTMRNRAVDKAAASVFGTLSARAIANQIASLPATLPAIFTATLEPALQSRLDELKVAASAIRSLTDDAFKPAYTDAFAKDVIELRAAGIVAALPKSLKLDPNSNSNSFTGIVIDPSDASTKEFANLRGSGSVVYQLNDFTNTHGGNHQTAASWMEAQGMGSNYPFPLAVNYLLSTERNIPPQDYFWYTPKNWREGYENAKQSYNQHTRESGGKASFDATFQILHAFTYELLTNVHVTDVSQGTQKYPTVYVYRTENPAALQDVYHISVGEKDLIIPRAVAASTSAFQAVQAVAGGAVTVQFVPDDLVLATYFPERTPGSNQTPFLYDTESEFVALPAGIPFDYTTDIMQGGYPGGGYPGGGYP